MTQTDTTTALLVAVNTVFYTHGNGYNSALPSKVICEALGVNGKLLANRLRPYGLVPGQISIGGCAFKGYRKVDVHNAMRANNLG